MKLTRRNVLMMVGALPALPLVGWLAKKPESRSGSVAPEPKAGPGVCLVRAHDLLTGRDREMAFRRVDEEGKTRLVLDVPERMTLEPTAIRTEHGWLSIHISPPYRELVKGDKLTLTLKVAS